MYIEKETLQNIFKETDKALTGYTLPLWQELPDIELYMDQVVSLLERYLEPLNEAFGAEKAVTPSMINNYVKLGIIPAPVKKRYSKNHLAYLLIICTLKQTLDMATIRRIIPAEISETETERIYNSFVENQSKAFLYVMEKVKTVADPIFELENGKPERMNDLIMQVAASANIFKILTEKIAKKSDKA